MCVVAPPFAIYEDFFLDRLKPHELIWGFNVKPLVVRVCWGQSPFSISPPSVRTLASIPRVMSPQRSEGETV